MEDTLEARFFVQLQYRLQIAKAPLCLLVSFSTLFGFLYATQVLSQQAVLIFFSVFILSCGAASLNSYQERSQDALMRRTQNRPLVKKRLTHKSALLQAVVLIVVGLSMLLFWANLKAFTAGVVAVSLYNYVYTRMKVSTVYAIIPGAICGAIPPYIGWLAAEGTGCMSLRAAMPVLLLFFWQIPHFFLVVLNHKEDYLASIFPNILKKLSEPALRRIFLPWITALSAIMLAFTVLPSHMSTFARFLITINAFVLFGIFSRQLILLKPTRPTYRYLFRYLNFSIFFMMLVVCSTVV